MRYLFSCFLWLHFLSHCNSSLGLPLLAFTISLCGVYSAYSIPFKFLFLILSFFHKLTLSQPHLFWFTSMNLLGCLPERPLYVLGQAHLRLSAFMYTHSLLHKPVLSLHRSVVYLPSLFPSFPGKTFLMTLGLYWSFPFQHLHKWLVEGMKWSLQLYYFLYSHFLMDLCF